MDTTAIISSTDFAPVIEALQQQISVASVAGVLAVVVAACVGLVFMWWGVRKGTRAIMAAFKKGKLSI